MSSISDSYKSMPPSLPNYFIKIDNTEQKNKPLPKGNGQLLCNCFFSSVSKISIKNKKFLIFIIINNFIG